MKERVYLLGFLIIISAGTLFEYFAFESELFMGNGCPFEEKDICTNGNCFNICGQRTKMGPYDATTSILLGPLSILISSVMIISFFLFQEMRAPPGNIILFISLVQFLQGNLWFFLGVSNLILDDFNFCSCSNSFPYSANSEISSNYCKMSGRLNIVLHFAFDFFNISFIAYVAICARFPLYIKKIPSSLFICLPILAISIEGYSTFNSSDVNPKIFGGCQNETSCSHSFSQFINASFVAIFMRFLAHYLESRIPQRNQEFKRFRIIFLKFYKNYIYAFVLIGVAETLLNLLIFYPFGDCNRYSFSAIIYSMAKIHNTIEMTAPLLLAYLRLQDPYLKRQIGRFIDDNYINQPIANMTEQLTNAAQDSYAASFFKFLSTYKKNSFRRSMNLAPEPLVDKDFEEIEKEVVDEFSLRGAEFLNSLIASVKNVSFVGKDGKDQFLMEIFAPKVFDRIMAQDGIDFDVELSLKAEENQASMRKAISNTGRNSGGRSGEMMFFTHDDNLIVKTASEKELKQLLEILKNYYNYLKNNPESKIARIYGIYSMTSVFSNETLNVRKRDRIIILMRNIIGVKSDFVMSKYDLKGSTVDRQVIPDEEYSKTTLKDLRKKILKDTDFKVIEKQLSLEQKHQRELLRILSADSAFLESQNLMDYSLLLVTVVHPPKGYEDLIKLDKNHILPKSDSPGVFYHIGIIDYLQTYDFKKASETTIKTVGRRSLKSDISSQPPDVYGARFRGFMEQIIMNIPKSQTPTPSYENI